MRQRYIKINTKGQIYFKDGDILKAKEKYIKKSTSLLIVGDEKQFNKLWLNRQLIWKKKESVLCGRDNLKLTRGKITFIYDVLSKKDYKNITLYNSNQFVIFSQHLRNIDIEDFEQENIKILVFKENKKKLFGLF